MDAERHVARLDRSAKCIGLVFEHIVYYAVERLAARASDEVKADFQRNGMGHR